MAGSAANAWTAFLSVMLTRRFGLNRWRSARNVREAILQYSVDCRSDRIIEEKRL